MATWVYDHRWQVLMFCCRQEQNLDFQSRSHRQVRPEQSKYVPLEVNLENIWNSKQICFGRKTRVRAGIRFFFLEVWEKLSIFLFFYFIVGRLLTTGNKHDTYIF